MLVTQVQLLIASKSMFYDEISYDEVFYDEVMLIHHILKSKDTDVWQILMLDPQAMHYQHNDLRK